MADDSSIRCRWKYDVFVSFRGYDIRKSFMDHLFKAFQQKRIRAFRDENESLRGEEMSTQLFKAIEESRFLIVIFSKNYASSSWCLRELVKILECKQIGKPKHEVRVLFYDVKPDVVRKQTEGYEKAFAKYQVLYRKEAAEWRKALSVAANLSGWDLYDMTNGYESKFIDSISKEILKKLCHGPLLVGENLVGVDTHVNKMNLLRCVGSDKVHMIGICGISGIGKTTLAKAIYNLMYIHFEEFSFCEDVQGVAKREGLTQVQRQVIDNIMRIRDINIFNISEGITVMKQRMVSKPILLVLDGVDHREQLEALAGSSNWFFPGSLIIFTSKDKQLLRSFKVDEIYDMEFLNDSQSLELFSSYAFWEKHPTKHFEQLAEHVVKYVQGHPLALKVLGCFLCGKTVLEWKSELDKLQVSPNEEIQQVLRLSYDGLDLNQKRILLDIACSFIGVNRDFAASVLDSCNLFADTNMRVLVDKSLISVSSTQSLKMHDLIRAMAKEIIHEESNIPGNRSRLWISSEVYDALIKNKVTEAVEVLVLPLRKSSQKVQIHVKAFAHMTKLRILKIFYQQPRDILQSSEFNIKFSGSLNFLSNELRLLSWHGCPFKYLPSNFDPENIVAIDLSYSDIKTLWTTTKCFRRLKVMKLRYCRNLTSTPDFTEITNLEELYFNGCVNLDKVHPSIGMLKRLIVLNMTDCIRFTSFPCKVEMESLKVLILSGCLKIDKLPEGMGTLKTLVELCVDRTAITEVPPFISALTNLQVLWIGRYELTESRWWDSIFQIQPRSLLLPSLASLQFLRDLSVRNCNLTEVSSDIGTLSCLQILDLSLNSFISLPGSLSQLYSLQKLSVNGCKKLEVLPHLPCSISSIEACQCASLQELPAQLVLCRSFLHFAFIDCPKLFRNLIESHPSMSPPQLLESSITSRRTSNKFASFLRNVSIQRIKCYLPSRLDTVFHGSRIPQWFTNQNIGSHVKVELPRDWCYNKFKGYGICVVFSHKTSYHKVYNYPKPDYFVHTFDRACLHDPGPDYRQYYNTESIGIHESDLIWLHYKTAKKTWKDAQNFVDFSFRDREDVKVKKCGVRLVCDEDIQQETVLGMLEDLPDPTQDGGFFNLLGVHNILCLW